MLYLILFSYDYNTFVEGIVLHIVFNGFIKFVTMFAILKFPLCNMVKWDTKHPI